MSKIVLNDYSFDKNGFYIGDVEDLISHNNITVKELRHKTIRFGVINSDILVLDCINTKVIADDINTDTININDNIDLEVFGSLHISSCFMTETTNVNITANSFTSNTTIENINNIKCSELKADSLNKINIIESSYIYAGDISCNEIKSKYIVVDEIDIKESFDIDALTASYVELHCNGSILSIRSLSLHVHTDYLYVKLLDTKFIHAPNTILEVDSLSLSQYNCKKIITKTFNNFNNSTGTIVIKE